LKIVRTVMGNSGIAAHVIAIMPIIPIIPIVPIVPIALVASIARAHRRLSSCTASTSAIT
jgi:hypothetical protein